ncbi:MAG: peptidyl-prolyl cis-trans isomerase [Xanthomonadales bacterium]|nr:peptidyl-prolyl cis-trans isomerase [Xanthomonadales bacterium]
MYKSVLLAVLLLTLGACSADLSQPTSGGVVSLQGSASGLVVNGEPVPQALLEALARKRGWNLTDPGQLAQVKEKVAELVAMAQQAQTEGLFTDPEIEAGLAFERLNYVAGKLLERQQQASAPSDEDLRAEFDRETALVGDSEYRIGHILFDQKAQAEQALAESGSEDFDALMARYQDQSGVRDARELGWVKRNQLPEVLREPLAQMEVGAVAEQVFQSEFGWHLIKLYETRPFEGPSFAQLKDAIRQSLERKVAAEYARKIREAASVEGL